MDPKLLLIFASCVLHFTVLGPAACAQPATTTSVPVVRNCSSVDSVQQAQIECLTREGLTYKPVNLSSGSEIKENFLESFLTDMDGLQDLCRDVSRFQRAIVCSMQVGQQCQPRDIWDYLPTVENARTMLAVLCDNIKAINVSCAKSVAPRLFDCTYNKVKTYASENGAYLTTKDILCKVFSANAECYLEVFPTCGCRITKLYVEISKLYLNPPGCSPITLRTPECQAGTDEFVDSGAAMQQKMSLPTLLVLVLCAVYRTAH